MTSFIACALTIPFNLYADSNYSKHCAACHGENGEGGFGPALAGTKLDKDQFKKIVRSGSGMMPAIFEGELNNEELDEIYSELSRSNSGAGAGIGISFVTKNVKAIAWGSIFIMLAGAFYIVAAKYIKWSALISAKKYYSALGIFACLKIVYKAFFSDTLSVSSVFKKDKKRWLIHGLIAYGFIGLIIADIMISLFNPARAALPLSSPLKIFVNLSGLALLTGLGIVIYRLFTDPYENNGITLLGDILFISFLMIVILSGFATEAVRYLKFPQYVQYTYFIHILFIVFLFVGAPFTRFVHILSTFFFVLNTRLAEAVACSGLALEFNEEPAPGRHFKSERIAKSLFGDDTKIRYFP
jgi:nitrate reductase gamma subunit